MLVGIISSSFTVREMDARGASAANAMSTWEARRLQPVDYGLEVKSQPRAPAYHSKQTQKSLGWPCYCIE